MELPAKVKEGAEEVMEIWIRMFKMMMLMMVMTTIMGVKMITTMTVKVTPPTGMCCTLQTAVVPSQCLDSTTLCHPCWKSGVPAG